MGSSSLSSDSWWPRAGWQGPSSSSSSWPGGSALLQQPDVSSVPSGPLLSAGAEAARCDGPSANELPGSPEQEASQGGSAEEAAAVSLRDPEGSDEAGETSLWCEDSFAFST